MRGLLGLVAMTEPVVLEEKPATPPAELTSEECEWVAEKAARAIEDREQMRELLAAREYEELNEGNPYPEGHGMHRVHIDWNRSQKARRLRAAREALEKI